MLIFSGEIMKIIFLTFIVFVLLIACKEKALDPVLDTFAAIENSSCLGCHTDKDLLAEIAEPLEDEGGEGGEG